MQLYFHACAKWERDFTTLQGFSYLLLSTSSLPPLQGPTRTQPGSHISSAASAAVSYHLPVQDCASYRQTWIPALQPQFLLGPLQVKKRGKGFPPAQVTKKVTRAQLQTASPSMPACCWEERRCRCVPAALPGTHAPCPGGNFPQSPVAARQALCLRTAARAPA